MISQNLNTFYIIFPLNYTPQIYKILDNYIYVCGRKFSVIVLKFGGIFGNKLFKSYSSMGSPKFYCQNILNIKFLIPSYIWH